MNRHDARPVFWRFVFSAPFFEALLSDAARVTGNIGADHRLISISARILRMPGAPAFGDNTAAAARRPSPRRRPDDEREVRGKRMNIILNAGNVDLKRFSELLAEGSAYPPDEQNTGRSAVSLLPR